MTGLWNVCVRFLECCKVKMVILWRMYACSFFFLGNEIEDKVYKQSRVLAIEDKPQTEHEKAIEQDNQTCNQLPVEVCLCQMFQLQFRIFRKWKTVFF